MSFSDRLQHIQRQIGLDRSFDYLWDPLILFLLFYCLQLVENQWGPPQWEIFLNEQM